MSGSRSEAFEVFSPGFQAKVFLSKGVEDLFNAVILNNRE